MQTEINDLGTKLVELHKEINRTCGIPCRIRINPQFWKEVIDWYKSLPNTKTFLRPPGLLNKYIGLLCGIPVFTDIRVKTFEIVYPQEKNEYS